MKKISFLFFYFTGSLLFGQWADTIRYQGNYSSHFSTLPGESMLMVYSVYSGMINGVDIPIYQWGTGDQSISVEIYKLKYPLDENQNSYPDSSVNYLGWLGGWHNESAMDSLYIDSSATHGIWDQFPGDAGACNSTPVVANSRDPLGERIWPPEGTDCIMTPGQYADIESGGND